MSRSTTSRARHSSVSLMRMGIFTALIAVGAFIRIPVPVCPFTLQLLFTTLAGLLLGSRRGGMAVLVYLVLGLVGVPVFTEGGGIAYIFQPTFGYLIGFAAGAWLTGKIIETSPDGSLARYVAACLAGLAVVYGCGMAYVYVINNFYLGTPLGLWPLILYCFLLAVPGDLVLCMVAAVLGRKIRKSGVI